MNENKFEISVDNVELKWYSKYMEQINKLIYGGIKMSNTRISRKDICTMIENINNSTNYIVKASFTDGCGTYLTIDGIEYKHIRMDGTGEGLTNKEIFKMLMKL